MYASLKYSAARGSLANCRSRPGLPVLNVAFAQFEKDSRTWPERSVQLARGRPIRHYARQMVGVKRIYSWCAVTSDKQLSGCMPAGHLHSTC